GGFAQGDSFFGDRVAGAHDRTGAVAAGTCGVGHAGDRELRLIEELRLACGSRWRGLSFFRRLSCFDWFGFLLRFLRPQGQCKHRSEGEHDKAETGRTSASAWMR